VPEREVRCVGLVGWKVEGAPATTIGAPTSHDSPPSFTHYSRFKVTPGASRYTSLLTTTSTGLTATRSKASCILVGLLLPDIKSSCPISSCRLLFLHSLPSGRTCHALHSTAHRHPTVVHLTSRPNQTPIPSKELWIPPNRHHVVLRLIFHLLAHLPNHHVDSSPGYACMVRGLVQQPQPLNPAIDPHPLHCIGPGRSLGTGNPLPVLPRKTLRQLCRFHRSAVYGRLHRRCLRAPWYR
jgi:hypothetical protein